MWLLLLLASAVVGLSGAADGRPFTTDDLLRLQALGPAVVSPHHRWLVLEVEAPYRDAVRFDNDTDRRPLLAHLDAVDLRHPTHLRPAFPQARRGGYIAGPFSPSGDQMVVYRCLGARWELGVAELRRGRVRWLGVGAELADWGDTVAWRSERELLVLALPRGVLPQRQRLNRALMTLQPSLWRKARTGGGSTAVTLGSGQFVDVHPQDLVVTLESIDTRTGARRALAHGGFESLALSPSGRWLSLVETGDRIQTGAEKPASLGTPWRRRRLRLYDLATTQEIPSGLVGDLGFAGSAWAPDSDRLLVFARGDDQPWKEGRYYLVEPGRAARPLELSGLTPVLTAPAGVGLEQSHAVWLDHAPVVLARPDDPGGRADWYRIGEEGPVNLTAALSAPGSKLIPAGSDALVADAAGSLWRVTGNGSAERVAGAGDSVLEPLRADLTGPAASAAAEGQGGVWIARRDDHALTLTPIAPGAEARPWRLPKDAPLPIACTTAVLLHTGRDAHGVETVSVIDQTQHHRPLLTLNRFLEGIAFATPIEIDHTGPEGQPLKSWFYRPTVAAKSDPPPLIVEAYPGWDNPTPPTLGEPGAIAIDDNPQLAAARGYAVLVPTLIRGPTSTDPGLGWSAQLWPIVGQLADQGLIDPSRVVYWGHSFGGYVGLMLATETDRFRAIAAAAAPSDLISWRAQAPGPAWVSPEWPMLYAGLAGWSETGSQGHLEATPWSDLRRYVANSPALAADRIHTPILLVQGDQDPVSLAQGQEMFSDLYRLHKDAELVTFFGENHTITSPSNVRRYFDSVLAFFDAALGFNRSDTVQAAQALAPVTRPALDGRRP